MLHAAQFGIHAAPALFGLSFFLSFFLFFLIILFLQTKKVSVDTLLPTVLVLVSESHIVSVLENTFS